MNKYKLHQWLALLFSLVIISSCSKRNYPDNSADIQDRYKNSAVKPAINTPEPVIIISDDLAKSNKDGEMYYDNADGYRYWKSSDGKYYLDTKYEYGAKPDKRVAKKAIKKRRVKVEETDYAHQ